MKIRLAILERDQSYLNRIVSVFSTKYSDKFEIYSFTNMDVALETLDSAKIDVLIANDAFDIDCSALPKRCGFAYLVDSPDVETLNNQRAIAKFQKVDLIYKQILNIYSENSTDVIGMHFNDNENTCIIGFLSPAGGTGCSTAAAACAVNFAKKNKKVLYLNLETFGSSDVFFRGEGTSDFSDVIYAIKSKKVNTSLKLESTVKQDKSGVFYYSATKTALDMLELKPAELKRLLVELRLFGAYDYIVLDLDFSIDDGTLELLNECNRVVFVSDGSAIANTKLERAIETLAVLEQQNESKLFMRTGVLYNRVSSQTSSKPNLPDIKEFGGIKRYEGYSVEALIGELSNLQVFDSLL